jgi:CHAT domain-containing protein
MLNPAKYLVIWLVLFYSGFTLSAETDSHIWYFSILNNDKHPEDPRNQFRKALDQTITSEASADEILFLKACFVFSCYNNCEFSYKPMLNECMRALQDVKDPLNKDLADVYLVMAQYYLSTNEQLNLSTKLLYDATLILNRYYSKNDYRLGILSYLKGYQKYRSYNSLEANEFFKKAKKILKDYPSLKTYYFMTCDLHVQVLYNYQYEKNRVIIEEHSDLNSLIDEYIKEFEANEHCSYSLYFYKGLLTQNKELKYKLLTTAKSSEGKSAVFLKSFALNWAFTTLLYSDTNVEKQCKQALQILKKCPESNLEALYIYSILGNNAYNLHQFQKSLDYYQQAIILGSEGFNDLSVYHNPKLEQIKPIYSMIEVFTKKAYAFSQLNSDDLSNVAHALEADELAVKIMDRFAVDMEDEYEGLSLVDERKTTLNNTVIYGKYLYEYLHENDYLERAFYAAEKSKMRILLSGTLRNKNMKDAGIPDSLAARYTKLNNSITREEHEISLLHKEDKKLPYRMTECLAEHYNQRDELNYLLYKNFPLYKTTKYNVGSVKIKDIMNFLASDQVFIEYQLTFFVLYTFVITQDTFFVHTDRIDSSFLKQLDNLRKQIITNPLNQKPDDLKSFIKTSSWLYNYLIAPVYKEISGKRLIIIPGNNLTQIPFEVLVSKLDTSIRNYTDLPYLVKEFPISYAYSSAFLINDNSGNKYGKGTGIFMPDYSNLNNNSLYADLAGARFEASVLKKYKGSRLFKNRNATETVFKKKAPGFNILHIAAHTDIDSIQAGLSCFILDGATDSTDDGRLYSYEISETKLNARLVVLSGCSTGYGRLMLSEGLVSLARSFFYTGVRTVVFTLWNVADDAGSKISTGFYEQMSEHQTLDVAMRNAKQDYLKNADPLKAHPYYWAGYIVLGRTREIDIRKSRHIEWIASITIVLLIPLFIFVRRKWKINRKSS